MAIDGDLDRARALKRMREETQWTAVPASTTPGNKPEESADVLWTLNPEPFPIKGLMYRPNFLTAAEQQRAIDLIDAQPFSTAIARRQQFWGETYYHTTHNLSSIQPTSSHSDIQTTDDGDKGEGDKKPLPLEEFRWLLDKLDELQMEATESGRYKYQEQSRGYEATPPGIFTNGERPTQILVNEYVDEQGIAHHLDDPFAFGHILVMISLVSPIFMTFTLSSPVTPDSPVDDDLQIKGFGMREKGGEKKRTKVLLEPGSLIVMKADARYNCVHGITRQKWLLMPDGEFVCRLEGSGYRRLSLTIRQLLDGRKRVTEDSKDWIDGPKVSV